jgi:hypothetical protein
VLFRRCTHAVLSTQLHLRLTSRTSTEAPLLHGLGHPVWQPEGHLGKLGAFPCYNPRKMRAS